MGLAAGFDAVGQGACQVGQRVDGGLPGAQDVAYGALAGVLAVDVGFEAGLVVAELALQGCGVEVSDPAFCRVGVCALLGCAEQGLGVEWDGRLQVHAGFEGVLLVAGVQGHPGVGLALPWGVAGASAGVVLDAQDWQAVDELQAAESTGVCAKTLGARARAQMSDRRIHNQIKL